MLKKIIGIVVIISFFLNAYAFSFYEEAGTGIWINSTAEFLQIPLMLFFIVGAGFLALEAIFN